MFKKLRSILNQSKDRKLRKQLVFQFGNNVPMEYLDGMFRYIKSGSQSSENQKDDKLGIH